MRKKIELTGRVFGAWTVAGPAEERTKLNRRLWTCRCQCGVTRSVVGNSLLRGVSSSCGCLAKEPLSSRRAAYGADRQQDSPGYSSWRNAWLRCNEPKTAGYELYGGRGIKFRLPAYREFWRRMHDTWFEGAQLDRKDNDGHYEFGNVRWVTPKVNSNNSRANRNLTFKGETRSLTAWSETLGINPNTLFARIRAGWAVDQALTQPVHPKRKSTK